MADSDFMVQWDNTTPVPGLGHAVSFEVTPTGWLVVDESVGTEFSKIRRYRNSIGRNCMHCNRPATVVAERRRTRQHRVHQVRYCDDHAAAIIDKDDST